LDQPVIDLSKTNAESYDRKIYKIHDNLTVHVQNVKLRQNFQYDALIFTRLPKEDDDKERNPFKFHVRADVIPRIITALNQIVKKPSRTKQGKKK
jgi:hypothetical protein